MIDLGKIVKSAQKAAADNTPMILTALGVTGLVATAVLTGQASFKAAEVLERHDCDVHKMEIKEKANLVWKLYIPALGVGASTIACIIAANRIHTRRAAALATAYSVVYEGFQEYKSKVRDKIGEKKEKEVRDEIAQDRVSKTPKSALVVVDTANTLCLDTHSGRYFQGSLEGLKKAENDTNYQILHDDYASLSDFWDRVGLPKTSESDELGWSTDSKLQVEYGSTIAENGVPCITIGFMAIPIRGYWNVYN